MRCGVSALVVLGLVAGCASTGGPESPPLEGKLSSNGLALDTALLDDLGTAPLADAAPGASLVALAPAHDALAADPAGRDLLRYLALCALDPGTELAVAGEVYDGLYGLAPEWADAACDDSCQRWVTACVLSHANAFGDRVTVSLRGDHPGMRWDDDVVASYASQEGAFYGNLFASPPEMYSCAGRAFSLEGEAYLDRLCGVSGLCGIEFTGPCHQPGATSVDLPTGDELEDAGSTCKDDAGAAGFYQRCHTTIGDVFGEGPAFDDVITVYTSRP